MNLARWIIGAAAILALLVVLSIAGAAFWLNSFIHSDAFRVEVQNRASASLGFPVRVKGIDLDLLHGIKLEGLVVQGDVFLGKGSLDVQVETIECTYAWGELLHRRLKLTGLILTRPQIVLSGQARNAPTSAAAPPTSSEETSAATASAPSGPAPAPSASAPATASPAPSAAPASLPGFQFVLDRVRIIDGSAMLLNEKGGGIVQVQGLNLKADLSPAGDIRSPNAAGTVTAAALTLVQDFHATDLNLPFTQREEGGGTLNAGPFDARAYDGRIKGTYTASLTTTKDTPPSMLDLNLQEIDVERLMGDLASNLSWRLTGKLGAQSKWRGVEGGGSDLTGEGDLQVTGGRLQGLHMLDQVAEALRIDELKDPAFSRAQAHFSVREKTVQVTGLKLESKLFSITGGGTIDANRDLNFNLVLALASEAMGRLPKEVAASFVPQPDGSGTIAFSVTGNLSSPQTDLPSRLLLQNTKIQNFINKQLGRFFKK